MTVFKKKKRTLRLLFAAGLYLTSIGILQIVKVAYVRNWNGGHGDKNENGRHLLQMHVLVEGDQVNCTPRAVDEFPGDFFTRKQKEEGGVVIHVLIALYMFAGLALICDDYFVASLEHICTALNLQHDVAGATFMAAGSSAPELATSVIGVFIAKSDIGTGTIVGSAVFNILFIIALCGLFGGMVIELTWFPLFRDCLFYMLSVVALILVMYDGDIFWYEAMIMLLMYILYIVLMYFNPSISSWCNAKVGNLLYRTKSKVEAMQHGQTLTFKNSSADETTALIHDDEDMLSVSSKPESEERSVEGSKTESNNDEEYESPWEIPDGFLARIYWVSLLPIKALVFITVPDCRKPGYWQKLYMATFVMSVAWIIGMAYVMVWMVAIIGDVIGIPDTVMGLTLLAAGTSVPDALASLYVCRDGYGDMAVSNSIGSNVFDILLCLGLPWFIYTLAVSGADVPLNITSNGLIFASIALLSTVLFMVVGIGINGWKLDKKFGVICIAVYVIFMVFSCLYELNVFGYVNPPPCPRKT